MKFLYHTSDMDN